MNIRKFLFFTLVAGINVLTYSLPSRAMEEDAEIEKTSLTSLPVELHVLITGHLRPRPRHLGTLALVSKHWKMVAEKDEIWRRVAVSELLLDSEKAQEKTGLKEWIKEVFSSPIVLQIKNATEFRLRVGPEVVVSYGSSEEAIDEWENEAPINPSSSTVGQTLIIFPPEKFEAGSYITIRQGEIENRALTQIKKMKEEEKELRKEYPIFRKEYPISKLLKTDENTDILADEIEESSPSPAQNDPSVYTLAAMNLRLGNAPRFAQLKNDEDTEITTDEIIDADEMMESVSSPAQNDLSFYTGRELNLKPVIVNFYPDTKYKYKMIPRSSGYVPLKIVSDE